MMRSVTLFVLLGFLARAFTKELAVNDAIDSQDSNEKSVNNLVDQVLKVWAGGDLDGITLSKEGDGQSQQNYGQPAGYGQQRLHAQQPPASRVPPAPPQPPQAPPAGYGQQQAHAQQPSFPRMPPAPPQPPQASGYEQQHSHFQQHGQYQYPPNPPRSSQGSQPPFNSAHGYGQPAYGQEGGSQPQQAYGQPAGYFSGQQQAYAQHGYYQNQYGDTGYMPQQDDTQQESTASETFKGPFRAIRRFIDEKLQAPLKAIEWQKIAWSIPGKVVVQMEIMWNACQPLVLMLSPLVRVLPAPLKDTLLGVAIFFVLSVIFKIASCCPVIFAALLSAASISALQGWRNRKVTPSFELFATTSPDDIGFLGVALVGFFVGSKIAFATIRFRQCASTAGEQPLLAEKPPKAGQLTIEQYLEKRLKTTLQMS